MPTEIFVALIGLAGLVIPLSTLLEYDAEAIEEIAEIVGGGE